MIVDNLSLGNAIRELSIKSLNDIQGLIKLSLMRLLNRTYMVYPRERSRLWSPVSV